MTSKANHMARSHRSYNSTKSLFGTIQNRNHISRASKQVSQTKFQSLLTSMATRMKKLTERLNNRFSNSFRKQER